MQNAQSIAPSLNPVASPQIDAHESQGTLHMGPLGIASRSDPPPENRQFWMQVNAVTFAQRGAGRRAAYRAVAFYCSLRAERVCWAAVATQAERAGLGTTVMRGHLRWFEANGYVTATGSRLGGRSKGASYSLILPPPVPDLAPARDPKPNGKRCPKPNGYRCQGRKEVPSTILELFVRTEDVRTEDGSIDLPEDVRTPEQEPPATIPTDPLYPPIPSFSQTPYTRQTLLYAKLYRLLATPDWPILTDDLLDAFERYPYSTKKTILDGLLDQEQQQGKGHGRPRSHSAASERRSIVNMLGAALTGTRTPADNRGHLPLYTACEQHGHTWTEDGPFMECHKCGKSTLKPHETADTVGPNA